MGVLINTSRLAGFGLLTGLLAGCGAGDAVVDYMGFGKYSPDESRVTTNQTLVMPPDLQLRPPGEGQATQAPAQQSHNPSQLVTAAPPSYGTVEPGTTYDASLPSSQSTGTQAASTQPVVPQATAPATGTQDVYAKWGISKTHPDGRAKTDTELREELRRVALARKKAQNPNYGTIFNLPNVWSD